MFSDLKPKITHTQYVIAVFFCKIAVKDSFNMVTWNNLHIKSMNLKLLISFQDVQKLPNVLLEIFANAFKS